MLKHIFLLTLLIVSASHAGQDTLRVSIHSFPPFIIQADDQVRGFDIDLWEKIAKGLDQPFTYIITDSLSEFFQTIDSRKADLGISGITINSQREIHFDFSHAYLTTGLNTLVKKRLHKSGFYFLNVIFTSRVQQILLIIVLFIVFCSHLIWFVEKGRDSFNDNYFPGIFEGAWWTVVTMSTVGYGDIAPKKWAGRITAFFVILMGITFFGIAVAELSSSFTKEVLLSDIQTVHDLRGKNVAVITGTTSHEEAKKIGVRTKPVSSINEAIELLKKDQVAGVIADEPLLRYTLKNEKDQFVLLKPFKVQEYGLVLQSNSNLRERVNRELLKIKESKEFTDLYDKWFELKE